MQLAIAQLNAVVGDLHGNGMRLLDAIARSSAVGAKLVVTPELSLCGYPPEDLLLRSSFLDACARELVAVAGQVRASTALIGFPEVQDGKRYNALAVCRDGRVLHVYRKQRLPNYTIFDEARYFSAGVEPCVFDCEGMRVGVLVCEDVWSPAPARAALDAGARMLVVANASPFHTEQQKLRTGSVALRARETGLAIVYANQVGGQDELVFDGASFVVDPRGAVVQQLPAWCEAIALVHFDGASPHPVRGALDGDIDAQVYQALVTGARDYANKNGFTGVLIGLSGGIDSALTLAIAVDALGRDRVRAMMLPSAYNAAMSVEDARSMAGMLGVRYDEIAIDAMFGGFLDALAPQFTELPADTTEENLQARIRGTLLMAMSNKLGLLLLTTGNKSEMAVGYATLYGDMAGGFAVLKDISKTRVYRLAAYRNRLGRVIPGRIITRAPSAELREGQLDCDTLPPYDVLDAILEAYVENDRDLDAIVGAGFAEQDVRRVAQLVKRSEFKRRQSAVGIRVTPRAFGKDWRYPIASAWEEPLRGSI